MEGQNNQNLNPTSPVSPIEQTPPSSPLQNSGNQKSSSIVKIIVLFLCFIIGGFQILVSVLLLLFVVPQLKTLQNSLGIAHQTNFYLTYTGLLITSAMGCLNIFFGFRLLKKSTGITQALIFLVVSFVTQGVLVGILVNSIINPIYRAVSEVGNNQMVTSPTPTPDPTANWKTYNGDQFSFKYPSDWTTSSETGQAEGVTKTITSFVGNEGTISIPSPLLGGMCDSKYYEKIVADNKTLTFCHVPAAQNVSKKDRWEYWGSNEGASKGFSVTALANSDASIPLIKQILSTFKFIDQNQKNANGNVQNELGDFPIYPGATFVEKIPKIKCSSDVPPDSSCYNDQYLFSTSDSFQKVYGYDINITNSGWSCSGGAGQIDKPTPTSGSTVTSCKKGSKNYFYTRVGDTNGTKITIGIPAN